MSSIRMRLEAPPTAIRPTAPEDAPAQLALRLSNREHTGPWDPVRDDSFQVVAALGFRIRPEQEFTRIVQLGRMGYSGETYAFDK